MQSPCEILKKYWGFDSFRKNQGAIINSVLEGKDTLALLPTGGGKSICYQVPALCKDGFCIVVSPLIALMEDQVNGLKKKGINAIALTSGMSQKDLDRELDNCIFGNVKFLYVSPERLQSKLFLERLKQMNTNLIAIDESHCISQWGHDFRPPYLEIHKLREFKPDVPILAVTATATTRVKNEIIEFLKLKKPAYFESSFERTNIAYVNLKCENKLLKLVELNQKIKGSGIVYCSTRANTVEIAKLLKANGIDAVFYHGGLNPAERSILQQRWIENQTKVIVATNAFGMGVDKPDVRFVIHFNIPSTPEAYFQEAGRAGRDELKARAVLLYEEQDVIDFQKRARAQFPEIETIKRVYKAICNHLQVPFESGKDNSYSIDLPEFASKYNIVLSQVYYSIKILELNNNIKLTEDWSKKTRVQILLNNQEIYDFILKNRLFEPLLLMLTRAFPGIFTTFKTINEYKLSKHLKISSKELHHQLNQLSKLKVIDLELGSSLPQILFLENRIHDDYFSIDSKVLAQRKAVMEEKLQAMARYVKSNFCRANLLLEYFGQEAKEPCGQCDYCLNLNNQRVNFTLKSCAKLLKIIEENQPIIIYDLMKLTDPMKSSETVAKLEWLNENNHIWLKDEWVSL